MREIIKVSKYHWKVPSESEENVYYDVVLNERIRKFTCNCPAFLFINRDFKPCKHIYRLAKEIKEGKPLT